MWLARDGEANNVVLVVDDDPDFLDLMDAVLSPEGYAVLPCLDAGAAYSKAKQYSPAVVIVDLLMPGVSGWQLIEQLKGDPQTAGVHIIVCTGAAPEAMLHQAALRQLGCDVLLKPFELDDLLAMLEKAIAKRRAG
jgi:CheY-like chemotaxis protein